MNITVRERISGSRVLVIGDAILDRYRHGTVADLCREAPAPKLELRDRIDQLGGAANVAANLHALGAFPLLISVIGEDEPGQALRAAMEAEGLDTGGLTVDQSISTSVCTRYAAAGHLLLRVDDGRRQQVSAPAAAKVRRRVLDELGTADVILCSDYDGTVLSDALIADLASARSEVRPFVVDAHKPERFREMHPTVVTPNATEAGRMLGTVGQDTGVVGSEFAWLSGRSAELFESTGAANVVVTLGAAGSLVLCSEGQVVRVAAHGPRAVLPVGAGDTFVATLALLVASGSDVASAAQVASVASGSVVSTSGTSVCSAERLSDLLGESVLEQLWSLPAWLVNSSRERGRIVFTNGCFDLLHPGHIDCLTRAKELGDVLVVAVNSDAGVRRLKGPTRPVVSLADRMRVLKGLAAVDVVVAFDADRPLALIEQLRPDVYVKGDDHKRENLVEGDLVERYGGVVHLVPTISGRSTTALVDRIHELGQPADGFTISEKRDAS